MEVLGEDVVIDADIPGPIYGNPNVPGKDQIGRSGPAYTFRPKPPLRDGPDPEGPGPGEEPGADPDLDRDPVRSLRQIQIWILVGEGGDISPEKPGKVLTEGSDRGV